MEISTVSQNIIDGLKAINVTLSEVRIELHPNDAFDSAGKPQPHLQSLILAGFRKFDICEFEADQNRASGVGRINDGIRKSCMAHALAWGSNAREAKGLLTSFGPDFLRTEVQRLVRNGMTPAMLLAASQPKKVASASAEVALADLESLFE